MRQIRKLVVVGLMTIATAVTSALTWSKQHSNKIVALTPAEIKWFTPPYYNDGRQRAQLIGDSSKDGPWIDRVKIPSGARVRAHTHPQDELVTVIEGTWYLGEGDKFDAAKLKPYPAGSFIVIPAGISHFVAAKEGSVIVQLSGTAKFSTEYLEK
jgi:quercetin dioxygenase-like cupin family protein